MVEYKIVAVQNRYWQEHMAKLAAIKKYNKLEEEHKEGLAKARERY